MIYRHQEEQLLIGVLQGLRNLMFLWGTIQFLPVSLYGQRLATLVFACKKNILGEEKACQGTVKEAAMKRITELRS